MMRKHHSSLCHLKHHNFKDQWKTEHMIMEVEGGEMKETQRLEYRRRTQILQTIASWSDGRTRNNHITDYVRG